MEELALEAVAPRAAVGRVAGQRVADRGEVGADLVGAAGLQPRLQVALARQQLEHLEMGARLPRGGAGDRHPVALALGAADRGVDRPGARGEPAAGQRQVDAFDLALADRLLQRRVGLVGAGDDQQAAGAAVEPVDDPRPLRVLAAAEQLAELGDQRRALVRGRRVDDQAGGLVDHRQLLVGVDDPRRRRRLSHPGAPPGHRSALGRLALAFLADRFAQVDQDEEHDADGDRRRRRR